MATEDATFTHVVTLVDPAPDTGQTALPTGDTISDVYVQTIQTHSAVRELIGPIQVPTDVIVALIQRCDFRLLASWRATCHAFFAVVAAHLRKRYELCLQPFIDDVAAFDRLLMLYGVVVSGSVALRFFLPEESWFPKDLDLYVPNDMFDRFVMAVTNPRGPNFTLTPHRRPWVCIDREDDGADSGPEEDRSDREGSGLAATEPVTPSMSFGILEVRQFYTTHDRRVDIIRVASNNPVVAINRFWASLVMNFLRPDACVCGYPDATLARRGMLKPRLTQRDSKAVGKYQRRKFTITHETWRRGPEMWEGLFFGCRRAMVTSFRLAVGDERPKLPIKPSDRGWLINSLWPWDAETAQTADESGA